MLGTVFVFLSVELERLLKLEDVVDISEVKKLREEVRDLKKLNEGLKETSKNLADDNTVADKFFVALNEKSELITQCDTLRGQMKDLRIEVQSLKEAAKALEGNLARKEEAWAAERTELIEKLDSSNAQLVTCQVEALSSFEEGYGESVTRFARFRIGVKEHNFDCYLADVAKKNEAGKTDSSEAVREA